MGQSLVLYSCVLLFGTFISAVSQVLLKKAALRTYPTRIAEYLNVRVIAAYVLFFLASLLCIFAYKVVPLSFGPILEATSYVYVTVFGVVFFKEKITRKKIAALGLIVLGIGIYAIFG